MIGPAELAAALAAFPQPPHGWRLLRRADMRLPVDLDAALYAAPTGETVLLLPGSDSLVDWLWNLLPGWTEYGAVRWRTGYWEGALQLSAFLGGAEVHVAAGHSRGAAVLAVAANAPGGRLGMAFASCRTVHLFGCPMVARGAAPRPRVDTTAWVGSRDLVAQAPLTRLLGWSLPATRRIVLPGVGHAISSYAAALSAAAAPPTPRASAAGSAGRDATR